MTNEILVENSILKKQRQALINAFNESTRDIQGLPRLSISDKMDILGILAKHMDEVVDEYPVIKNLM